MNLDPISFSEYVLNKAEELFGTDDFNNNDVCNYYIANLKKNNKEISIREECLYDGYIVAYDDPDEEDCYYSVFLGTKEECEEFVKKNELKVKEEL